ncbi:hypothetical protein IWQ56_004812 [Coemansia nantahalensis]|uniref:Uncharacterized protein n=1 Tax=Coemansia nantahalensis TaxID=2789366 RepID=A0ACC1JV04_9FUNG|nr:hypothetical protein IWQ56_004812 [Coemansia nantahalensis]KAJ2767879.1 hypothetical protein IWQ57_003773 [Coemansia nantahalensis]
MPPRVRTAFRPLEMTSPFDSIDAMALRRAATSVPALSHHSVDPYAPERLQLLSRLEQRWCTSLPSSKSGACGDCFAPVPRRTYSPSNAGSRPTSSSSLVEPLVENDPASLELRGILGLADSGVASPSRSSSASSASSWNLSTSPFHETMIHPLEEIVVRSGSPILRSGNPMPLDAGFGVVM